MTQRKNQVIDAIRRIREASLPTLTEAQLRQQSQQSIAAREVQQQELGTSKETALEQITPIEQENVRLEQEIVRVETLQAQAISARNAAQRERADFEKARRLIIEDKTLAARGDPGLQQKIRILQAEGFQSAKVILAVRALAEAQAKLQEIEKTTPEIAPEELDVGVSRTKQIIQAILKINPAFTAIPEATARIVRAVKIAEAAAPFPVDKLLGFEPGTTRALVTKAGEDIRAFIDEKNIEFRKLISPAFKAETAEQEAENRLLEGRLAGLETSIEEFNTKFGGRELNQVEFNQASIEEKNLNSRLREFAQFQDDVIARRTRPEELAVLAEPGFFGVPIVTTPAGEVKPAGVEAVQAALIGAPTGIVSGLSLAAGILTKPTAAIEEEAAALGELPASLRSRPVAVAGELVGQVAAFIALGKIFRGRVPKKGAALGEVKVRLTKGTARTKIVRDLFEKIDPVTNERILAIPGAKVRETATRLFEVKVPTPKGDIGIIIAEFEKAGVKSFVGFDPVTKRPFSDVFFGQTIFRGADGLTNLVTDIARLQSLRGGLTSLEISRVLEKARTAQIKVVKARRVSLTTSEARLAGKFKLEKLEPEVAREIIRKAIFKDEALAERLKAKPFTKADFDAAKFLSKDEIIVAEQAVRARLGITIGIREGEVGIRAITDTKVAEIGLGTKTFNPLKITSEKLKPFTPFSKTFGKSPEAKSLITLKKKIKSKLFPERPPLTELARFKNKNLRIEDFEQFEKIKSQVFKEYNIPEVEPLFFVQLKSKIEPHVSKAIEILNDKGWSTSSSGFFGRPPGRWGHNIEFAEDIPSSIIKSINRRSGVTADIREVFIEGKGRSLSDVKRTFDDIARKFPDKSVTEAITETPSTLTKTFGGATQESILQIAKIKPKPPAAIGAFKSIGKTIQEERVGITPQKPITTPFLLDLVSGTKTKLDLSPSSRNTLLLSQKERNAQAFAIAPVLKTTQQLTRVQKNALANQLLSLRRSGQSSKLFALTRAIQRAGFTQRQRQMLIARQVLKRIGRPVRPKVKIPGIPKVPFVRAEEEIIHGGKLKKASKAKAFDVFAKVGGSFKQIGDDLPINRAKKLGALFTDRTLAATFKIKHDPRGRVTQKDIKKFTPSPGIFRPFRIRKGSRIPLKNEWIEKRGKRLSTKSEVSAILGIKRRKKRRRKKK